MDKNLYVIEENNTFNNIKNNDILKKDKRSSRIKSINNDDFRNKLKSKVNQNKTDFIRKAKIETFIVDVKKDPTLLKRLSNNRLKKLLQFLENDISQKEEELKKIQNNG